MNHSSKTLFTTSLRLSALSLAVALAACGGGGDPALPTTPATPAPAQSGLLMDANQASPYLVNSPEKKNFDELNRVRVAGGFGAMQYEDVMSKSATAHTSYASLTLDPGGAHIETVGKPGFTGVTVQDRCNAAAGGVFKFVCDEGGYFVGNVGYSGFDVLSYYSLATGHLQAALNFASNRGGLHIAQATISDLPSVIGFINMGYLRSPPLVAGHSIVGVYPFDGMTAVGTGQAVTQAVQGISILAQFPTADNPAVTSFTLRKDGATVDTPARIHEAGTYNGTEPTRAGWAILIPTVVLDANSKYNVKFVGSHGGVPTEKSWSFTTGSAAMTKMGG